MCKTTSRYTPTWLASSKMSLVRLVLSRSLPWRVSIRSVPAATQQLPRRHYSSNQSSKDAVGFIGLGNMGAPMANNLLAKGYPLVVYDVIESCVEGAVRNGAVKATSPAEVASKTSTVITMLPSADYVVDCYTGDNGILRSIESGSLLIDSSTIDQATVTAMAERATEVGASYIDAPVSGGVGAATKGVLTFMVGGSKESYDRATPLLECMGKAVMHCGESGAGQATKICNNMLLAISMIGVSEALQLGVNLGLDPKVLSSVVNQASGRCWSSDTYNPCPGVIETVPSSNNYQGGFKTGLMAKDLGLAMSAANSCKSVTPLGALSRQIYQLMVEQGHADKDFSYIFKFIEKEK